MGSAGMSEEAKGAAMSESVPPVARVYGGSERRDVLPFVPDPCVRLLDIGCGTGSFGAMLKRERGVEVWGVEPDPERARIASSRLDRVIPAFFTPEIDLPPGGFDVITFNDSLEHFPDPDPPLTLCKRFLASAGVVVCSLPNFRFVHNLEHVLLHGDFRYEDDGIRDRTHLRFFTRKSMRNLFESHGFEILQQQGIHADWWGEGELWRRLLFRLLPRITDDMRYVQFVNVLRLRERGTVPTNAAVRGAA